MRRKLKRSGSAAQGSTLARRRCAAVAAAVLCLAACSGTVSPPEGVDGNPGGPGTNAGGSSGSSRPGAGGAAPSTGAGGGAVDPGTVDPSAAGPRPLARLSRREYNNTVRDLLGDASNPADQFADDKETTFTFRRASDVATHDADLFRSTAQTLAAAASSSTNITRFVSCAPANGDETCARQFVQTFGQKAYRRPPTTGEVTRLIALYQAGRTTLKLSFAATIGMMMEAMLQSPAFLYHWEHAPDEAPVREGALIKLGPYEAASRLSYFLWGSMPDDKLMQAATGNHLSTSAELEAEAARMLADTKARDNVAAFFSELFELAGLPDRPKDPTVYAQFNETLAGAMIDEAAAFSKFVVFEGDGRLATMLGAEFSFVNQSLGKIYGANATGTALQKTALNKAERQGILTQTAFLTMNAAADGSHPVKRGKAVFEKLMCGELPPPPPVVPPAKPPSAGGTTRERFADHEQNACTGACHALMDPIGYAFEHYDGIGAFRKTDNGSPVNSATELELDGTVVPIADALTLVNALATSETVRTCMAKQMLRFALGRNDAEQDGASVLHAREAFGRNDFQLRDLIVSIASSRSFQYRSPADGEVTQ